MNKNKLLNHYEAEETTDPALCRHHYHRSTTRCNFAPQATTTTPTAATLLCLASFSCIRLFWLVLPKCSENKNISPKNFVLCSNLRELPVFVFLRHFYVINNTYRDRPIFHSLLWNNDEKS